MTLHKLARNVSMGLALLMGLTLAGCTKKSSPPNTPEGALEKYVTTAFSVKSAGDREQLLALSAGEALEHLKKMSEENFQKQFVDSKLRFVSMKTRDLRQEDNGDVSLVYELSFQDTAGGTSASHTNKKLAFLTKDETGEWKIRATKNVKTTIERKEDLVITPETSPPEK